MRAGAPDASLTPNAGMAAISELCVRLDVTGALDAAVGPIKQRDRGYGAGELLTGIAAAQLAGEDFLTGLDRHRADAAGQLITPVPGLASTTAAGLARRITPAQWTAVERGLAAVTGRMLDLLPAERAAALAGGDRHHGPPARPGERPADREPGAAPGPSACPLPGIRVHQDRLREQGAAHRAIRGIGSDGGFVCMPIGLT